MRARRRALRGCGSAKSYKITTIRYRRCVCVRVRECVSMSVAATTPMMMRYHSTVLSSNELAGLSARAPVRAMQTSSITADDDDDTTRVGLTAQHPSLHTLSCTRTHACTTRAPGRTHSGHSRKLVHPHTRVQNTQRINRCARLVVASHKRSLSVFLANKIVYFISCALIHISCIVHTCTTHARFQRHH